MWLLSFGPLTSPHLLFLIEREEDKERERRAAQPTDRHTEREKEREREREGPPYPSISTSHSFLSCSTPKAIPYLFLSLLSHCLLSHSPCPSKHTHETRRDETRRDKWANESRHCILWTNAICFCVCKAKLSHPIRSILFPARRNPKHTSSAPHHYHYHYGPTFTSIGFWVLSFGFWVFGFRFLFFVFCFSNQGNFDVDIFQGFETSMMCAKYNQTVKSFTLVEGSCFPMTTDCLWLRLSDFEDGRK